MTESYPTANYNTHIPDKITTPNIVEARIGTLNFFDGIPTTEITQKVIDNLDHMRGVEVFLSGMPVTSI